MLKTIGIFLGIGVVAGIALFLFAWYRLTHVTDNQNLEASIDKQVARYLQEGKSYGMVIGVVKDGKTLIKGYGSTEKGGNTVPDSLSVFELASTSKLFTTATLQILVEEGRLKVTDKLPDVMGDKVKIAESAHQTTLQHLATHLSGFPSLPPSFLAKMTDEANPYKSLTNKDLYDYLATCEAKQPDGTFEYSNFGMGLLGHILSLKAQMPYEALVKNKLLMPLGMQTTFVTIDSSNKTHIVQGYDDTGKPAPIWEDTVLTGAGSFLSNGEDMIRFIKANLQANASPISTALLHTHQPQLDGKNGLGWILPSAVDKLLGNKGMVWHNGMAGGYASFISVNPLNQNGIVILSNKSEDVSGLGMKLTTLLQSQSWKK